MMKPRRGVTLVEMLAVVAIIGLLVALLLPAVQSARESGRRLQCANNAKQLASACLQHEAAQRFLPSGGWGTSWSGDPDRGYGATQPGNWLYSILPYIEQASLHDTGRGTTGSAKTSAINAIAATPIPAMYCPSRRAPTTYPDTWWTIWKSGYANRDGLPRVGKTDYAANVGDGTWSDGFGRQPTSVAQADGGTFSWSRTDEPALGTYCSGVIYYRSQLAMARIKDGISSTYLLGEKYLNPDAYLTAIDRGDNQDAFVGFEWDAGRVANLNLPPRQDTPGLEGAFGAQGQPFGSAHAGGYAAAFCDGSVRTVSYTISPETHRRLGNRQDLQTVDPNDL